jgi:predicted metal-dependent phosphoesterase TrpH
LREYRADLHVHSCLSPCGELEMSPRAIVEKGLERGMDIIALCDHNSAENVGAVMRAGAERGLCVFPGMEVNSVEEVHSLALFETEKQALALQETVYRHLRGSNRAEIFGDQVVANEFDEVEGFNDRLLIGAVQLTLQEVVSEVHRLGGLSIASHVNKQSFSLIAQLGFIPPDLEFDALEISRHLKREKVPELLPAAEGFRIVTSSDSHFLEEIGSVWTTFLLESPSLDEVRLALRESSGRRLIEH